MISYIFKKIPTLFALIIAFQHICTPLLFAQAEIDPSQKAVSYELCGRFGNRVITYLVAKWISEKNNLPLLYVPFNYSDQLLFHENEMFKRADWESKFKQSIMIKDESEIPNLQDSSIILVNIFRNKPNYSKIPFGKYASDPKFRKFVKAQLQPRYPIQTIHLPEGDRLNVLVHVRMGGGFDSRSTQLDYPNKFPPHLFYISAIEAISESFGHPLIYAYIMTDDLHPEEILQMYSKALAGLANIKFGCRDGESGPSCNVLEDFFSIPKFDCLIRGRSSFSIAATLLADFKAIVIPVKCEVELDKVIVKEMELQRRDIGKRTRIKIRNLQ